MVFSSLPLYHLDPPPNWPHQQLDRQLEVIHGENSQVPPPPLPPPLPPPPLPPPVSDTSGGDQGPKKPGSMADRARLAKITQPEASLKCPRCESTNTKFCYYNNYNLSQPRHFCKTCRRYWTRGGALRNVPVGGGCRRKNKRTKGTNSKKSPNKASSSSTSGHHLLSSPPLLFPPPSSYGNYDVAFGATNIKDAGFQIACSNNNSIIEQWKLPSLVQHHQQFPSTFLMSNLEVPSSEGLYNNAEIDPSMTTLLYTGNIGSDHHHGQISTTIKMEGDMDQVVGISKSLKGNSENDNDNNERFWEANNNGSAWDINSNNIY